MGKLCPNQSDVSVSSTDGCWFLSAVYVNTDSRSFLAHGDTAVHTQCHHHFAVSLAVLNSQKLLGLTRIFVWLTLDLAAKLPFTNMSLFIALLFISCTVSQLLLGLLSKWCR